MLKKLTQPGKAISLDDIPEENKAEQQPGVDSNLPTRELLEGFRQANVHIHLVTYDFEKLFTKSKFHNLFDIGVLSIHSDNQIKPEFNILFKDKAKILAETGDCLIVFKPEQKLEFKKKIVEKAVASSWQQLDYDGPAHHLLFEVSH